MDLHIVPDGPLQMNLELTTRCPLHCPQCYVSLDEGCDMELDTALYWLCDGAAAGVKQVNLSGGETMCYPHLTELIRECKRLGMKSAIALSGVFVTREKLLEFIEAGVSQIYISLNGSTKEVNEKTRDGYDHAINALAILQDIGFEERYINWVMHESNADDFDGMIALAERYEVKGILVLAFKPDSSMHMNGYPTGMQIEDLARKMKAYKGNVKLIAEPCFSQLRTLQMRSFFGSMNHGLHRGCRAGRNGISVSIDGRLTPCRHLDVRESYDHIMDYWNDSEFLKQLRLIEEKRTEPCKGCKWEDNCLPCMAVGWKLHGELRYGMEECALRDR